MVFFPAVFCFLGSPFHFELHKEQILVKPGKLVIAFAEGGGLESVVVANRTCIVL